MRRSARRLGLPALWHWWMTELAPFVPRGVRTAAHRRRVGPILVFGHEVAVLQVPRTTNGTVAYAEVARIALTGDAATVTNAGRAAIDSLARLAYGGAVAATKVAVVLPREQVLRKTLTLPAMVEDSLTQTLAYDIDRHTPFKADDVYFDAAIVGRDAARKEIRVDWAAALKSVVDQARGRAEAWGATVIGVWPGEPGSSAATAVSRLNLLPAAERPDNAGWRRWQIVAPALILLALALIAVALPLWQKRAHVIALMQVVEQARVQAGASDALRQQLDQMTGDYNFALQRKYAFPSTVQVLEDVTRILPDDTWLTQLEVKTPAKGKDPHRDIQLRGESANAGRLVSLLEESKLFGEAAPRSPTTKIQPGPGEIFDLGAQLKPLPLPPMVQLASLPRTAPPVEALVPKPGSPAPAAGTGNAPASTPPAAAPATKAANPAPSAATSGTQVSAEAGPEESETAPGAMRDPRAAPAAPAVAAPAPAGATVPAGASAAGATPAPATPAAGTRARGDPRTRGSQEVTQ